jgi:SAM-dependent methyltransferase
MTSDKQPGAVVEPRFDTHYVDWRSRRLAAIRSHYGDDFFRGRTVLELGCGYGDIGAALASLGASVTCCDARAEHLAVLQARFPHLSVVQADLNHDWPFGHFDLILHLGLLYHLEPSHRSLRHSCRSAEHLVLETEVCDSNSPELVLLVPEEGYDQAVHGFGCRPTARRVERLLAGEGVAFERVEDGRCNAGMHVYDWPLTGSGGYAHGQRRFWFARREEAGALAAKAVA